MHLRTLLVVLCTGLLLHGLVLGQDESEPKPDPKLAARTQADGLKLLLQVGTGGDKQGKVQPARSTIKEIKIGAEGCEDLKGFYSVPTGVKRAGKRALVVALHRSGVDGRNAVETLAKISTRRDPVTCIGITHMKEVDMGKGFTRYDPLVEDTVLYTALDWLLAKVMSKEPIDPERVFLVGTQGDSKAARWLKVSWLDHPEKFPFRAAVFSGMGRISFDIKEEVPQIPFVFLMKDYELQWSMEGQDTYKTAANQLRGFGVPTQFHEIESDMFQESTRWLQIVRDLVNDLGGPGARQYARLTKDVGVITAADRLPFQASSDGFIQEVMIYLEEEDWVAAVSRAKGIVKDKRIKSKGKRNIKKFAKEMEKYAKKELVRLNKSIEVSLKAEMPCHSLHRRRMTAIVAAYKGASWVKGKPYAENLKKLETYKPAQREKGREKALLEAAQKELAGDRAAAKKLYTALAKRIDEDGGNSPWPAAAKYRLDWWED